MTGVVELSPTERTLFAFERNAVVRASAGTGKTEALTGLYAHLVLGATVDPEALSPQRIVTMTFTEKATEEMRERIRHALRAVLGAGTAASFEGKSLPRAAALVRASLVARGREVPIAHLERALAHMEGAPIQTIHAVAARLVAAHGLVMGELPGTDVVDDGTARQWLEESIVVAVDAAVRGGDVAMAGLVEDIGSLFGRQGLVPALVSLVDSLREMGEGADLITRRCAHHAVAPRGDGLSALWLDLKTQHEALLASASKRTQRATRERVAAGLRDLATDPAWGSGDIEALARATARLEGLLTDRLKEPGPAADIRARILGLWAEPRVGARAAAVERVVAQALADYDARKRAAGAIDFTDQLRLARDLLRDHPDVRDDVNRGVGVLLVDEFQDTNVIQRDLVCLLRAPPGAPAGVPGLGALLPRGLMVVGDPKQSIYGFRNADVAVFREVVEGFERAGADVLYLAESFRSHGPLVTAINGLMAENFAGQGARDFELPYEPAHDDLRTTTEAPTGAPPVTLIRVPERGIEARRRQMVLVAEWVANAVRGPSPLLVREGGAVRAARFGDVAILLRAMTHATGFSRALLERGIPHGVVKGRGYFEALEISDVMALLRVLLKVDGGIDTVTLLRGPMVALRDRSLEALRVALGERAWWSLFSDGVPVVALSEQEALRLRLVVEYVGRARQVVDRVGLGVSARAVLVATGYVDVLRLTTNGRQRVANVERLVTELVRRERSGFDGRAVLRELEDRAERDRDGHAEVDDGDAVRIMTVHQAKGLQYPIVVAAELGAREPNLSAPVLLDRHPEAGFEVVAGVLEGKRRHGAGHERVKEVVRARTAAEGRRLFYVQATRARDHLVLAGHGTESPWKPLAGWVETELVPKGLAVAYGGGGGGAGPTRRAAAPVVPWEELLRRSRPVPTPTSGWHVSVTELEDVAACPRRFRAKRVLGLPEVPKPPTLEGPTALMEGEAPVEVDPRLRGTETHRVLEHLDYGHLATDVEGAAVEAARRAGVEPSEDLRRRLRALAESAYGRGLGGRRAAREVPVWVPVAGPRGRVVVRGQMDLVVDHGDGSVDIIDYKVTSPPKDGDLSAYRFQLAAYGEALRRGRPEVRVRAGVWFVDGVPREPLFLSDGDVEPVLVEASSRLLAGAAHGEVPGRERAFCDAIACGYRWLCHGVTAP